MKTFFSKPFRWATIFSLFMVFSATALMLHTFVIPRAGTAITVPSNSLTVTSDASVASSSSTTPIITDNSYQDDNIAITIETIREHDTTIYIADIQVSNAAYLKTAFANATYGRNIKEVTSVMAEDNNAIFAINGDYYGFRDYGFVLRNGVLYRDTPRASGDDDALVIDNNGDFSIINESSTDAQTLVSAGVSQVLSFGPALMEDGEITVTTSSKVDREKSDNPRTAIGQIDELHYIVVVSDGRTDESAGLTLLELAQVFKDNDCTTAYNLDGGGSSTIVLNGTIINNPTDGRSNSERSVSDIVYIGYE